MLPPARSDCRAGFLKSFLLKLKFQFMNPLLIKGAMPIIKPLAKFAIKFGTEYCKTLAPPPEGFKRIIQAIQDINDDTRFLIVVADMNLNTGQIATLHFKKEIQVNDENLENLIEMLMQKLK
jgi:hypothetical protein